MSTETTLTKENTVSTTEKTPLITTSIQERIKKIIEEQNAVVKGRSEVIHGLWVARVSQQHLLMLGPGGTGKSFLVRDAVSHIEDAKHFEIALDETTDPGQVFGPPDIPAMVKDGKNRRVVTNMLPEATDAFVDEIFNGNSPVLHSLMPIMNERIFHNNGMPSDVPLRSLYAGTNKLNADADLAAFFDRLHLRFEVGYLRGRSDQQDMVGEAIARMAVLGRGTGTSLAASKTKVTLDELDQANAESLGLSVPDGVMDLFLDLSEELKNKGIVISDRRKVEGMAAVLANAWIRGHEEVKAADLDILAHMWWTLLDQRDEARQVVLAVANPGEKAALDLMKDFRKIEESLNSSQSSNADPDRLRRVGVEVVRDADKLMRELTEHITRTEGAGGDSTKLRALETKVTDFKKRVGVEVFNLSPDSITNLRQA